MGKLVIVYGMEDELEEGLELLRQAGVTDAVSVVQRTPSGDDEADLEAGRRGRGGDADMGDEVVIPPSATLGANVPLGTPAVAAPVAVAGADVDLGGGPAGYTRSEIEDLTGARADEAEHLLDVVSGGGSLLVVEGDDRTLDVAQRALQGHDGQGAIRH